ncbi:MAG: hypothetical protein AAGG75_00505 [Bacteroidota bacterium]
MRHINVLVLLLPLFLLACNSNTESSSNAAGTAPVAAQEVATYPVLPMDEGRILATKCDYIDYLFYQLPMSMSFNDPASIQSALSYIDVKPAPTNPGCKSIGRVAFQSQGEILMEAELYFAPNGCAQFVFLKDNKPTYGNLMHPNGIKFLGDLINRAKGQPTQ